MMEQIRNFLRWVYNWITVLTGLLVGAVSYGMDMLNAIGAVDLTPILPPEHALKIVTGIAVAKGLHAWYMSRSAT